MNSKITITIALFITLLVLVFGLAFEPQMPDRMAIHWNWQGDVDGYGPRFIGIWFLPIVSIGLIFLLGLLNWIGPNKKNIGLYQKEIHGFVLFFSLFLAYAQVLTLFWNLGMRFALQNYLTPAYGGFVFYIGVLVSKVKRNHFVGIRTPWTLRDERVWSDTHHLGARLLKISSGIALMGILFPHVNLLVLLLPVFGTAMISVVYSWLRYRQYNAQVG